jgi:hypothetical protein
MRADYKETGRRYSSEKLQVFSFKETKAGHAEA